MSYRPTPEHERIGLIVWVVGIVLFVLWAIYDIIPQIAR